jgi:hypothetical protein
LFSQVVNVSFLFLFGRFFVISYLSGKKKRPTPTPAAAQVVKSE